MKSTGAFSVETLRNIETARSWMDAAESVIIGAGAGLSASGGLNYHDPELVRRWFPEYANLGCKTIPEIQSAFWKIETSDPELYWGYWARHIFHVRYEPEALEPYKNLKKLIGEKAHFVITTNVDGQFEKAGFSRQGVFAPQGDYGFFQCARPCQDVVFPNKEMVLRMVHGIDSDARGLPRIRREDIPRCPFCGAPLIPNLRCDNLFVETPHMSAAADYKRFVDACGSSSAGAVLLELGVGFNTPSIIRYPFEEYVQRFERFRLIRVNAAEPFAQTDLADRLLSLGVDAGVILSML